MDDSQVIEPDDDATRVALVRNAYETWNRQGIESLGRFLSDDATIEDASDLPDARVTRGAGAVIQRLKDVAQSVGGGSVEIQSVEPFGVEVLVAMIWNLDTSAGSKVSVGEVFHVVGLDGSLVCRIRVFLDRGSLPNP